MNDKLNPYINAEGQGELRDSVVAFVDVLGFKELVRDAKAKNNSQEFFTEFQNMILMAIFSLKDIFAEDCNEISDGTSGIKSTYKFRIFSDCILIGCPIREAGNTYTFIKGRNEFETVIDRLYFLQSALISHGFFVRGAISVGELYMDDTTIYGIGLIDAYEGELKQAKYPRIILTKSAKDMFMEINKAFQDQELPNYLSRYLYKDSDGLFFLNYLESINIPDEPFLNALKEHKEVIEKKLRKYHDSPHILEKYVWAANYHNCFCNLDNNNDYRIDLTQYQMQSI